MAKKKVPQVIEKVRQVDLVEVGTCNVTKDFRIHAKTNTGKDIYLGRHEIQVGRDDITSIVIQEENVSWAEPKEDDEEIN